MFKKVRLELARTAEFPDGSPAHGYTLIMPLGREGELDGVSWIEHQDKARVTKFWGSRPHRHGQLRLRTTHSGGRACEWYVRYDEGDNPETPETETEEEVGYHFPKERFVPGEYISFSDGLHEPMSFKVVAVTDADEPSVHRTHL